jgi:hypothetical protein
METEKRLKLLQLFYAGVLADSVSNYENFGITDKVTFKKAAEQEIMAKGQLVQLGFKTPEDLFRGFSEVFGCIEWRINKNEKDFFAEGNACLLCAISKRMNSAKPCNIYCINPIRSLLKNLNPPVRLDVKQTLWESDRCMFSLSVIDKSM